jgi:hypothetical protein
MLTSQVYLVQSLMCGALPPFKHAASSIVIKWGEGSLASYICICNLQYFWSYLWSSKATSPRWLGADSQEQNFGFSREKLHTRILLEQVSLRRSCSLLFIIPYPTSQPELSHSKTRYSISDSSKLCFLSSSRLIPEWEMRMRKIVKNCISSKKKKKQILWLSVRKRTIQNDLPPLPAK